MPSTLARPTWRRPAARAAPARSPVALRPAPYRLWRWGGTAPQRRLPRPREERRVTPRRRPTAVSSAAAVLTYVAVAATVYWNVWAAPTGRLVGPAASDRIQGAWFLAWTAHALVHHQPLFFTTQANYPGGVNLLVNTSMEALGVLALPVTLLWGPVAALNVLLIAGMAGSATAMYFLVRRWVSWRPAAFVAGLLYGYSPYMIGQGAIHLHLEFAVVPPLLLLCLDSIVVRQEGSPVVQGAVLGGLVVAQFFIASEVLATTAVMVVIGLTVVAWKHPVKVRRRGPYALAALGTAAVVALGLLVFPVWVTFDGPGHVTGPIQLMPQNFRADLLASVAPGSFEALTTQGLRHAASRFVGGYPWENGSYLGIPLLLVLGIGAVVFRRSRVLRFSLGMAAVAWLLSLGSRLDLSGAHVGAPVHGTPLPEALVSHLPGLFSVLPVRFSLYTDLFAALALGVVVNRVRFHRRGGSVAALALAAFALLPLVPVAPYPAVTVSVPPFFTGGAAPGGVVLTYPYPSFSDDDALPMLWQADAGFRFAMPGGYFITPYHGVDAGNDRPGGVAVTGDGSLTAIVFSQLYNDRPLAVTDALRQQLLAEWRSWGLTGIVAQAVGRDPAQALFLISWVVGHPPRQAGGVYLWEDPLGVGTAAPS